MEYSIIIGLLLGLGLSAAAGFKVFVPFLVMSGAAHFGYLELSDSFAWIGSTAALWVFGIATLLEILAYFIPVVDNLLDLITGPLAFIAGTVLMSSAIVELDPLFQWTIAIIAGGGTASIIKSGTTIARAASTTTTAGVANPLLNLAEIGSAFTLSILSIVATIIAGILVLFLLVKLGRFAWRKWIPT